MRSGWRGERGAKAHGSEPDEFKDRGISCQKGCYQNLQTINAGEGEEKREPSYTVGGNANQYSYYGEQCGDSLKNWKQDCRMTQQSHTEETRIERDMCTPMFIATLFYNSQDMEATQMSISRHMYKKAVVSRHNGILLSH